MSLTKSEELLFGRWAAIRKPFVSDGVVDEKAYLESNPKILFVLKEVNDPSGGFCDLRSFLRDGATDRTWNNITRWLYGIRSLDRDIPWNELDKISKDLRKEYLKSICAMNLKKSGGGAVCDGDKLWLISTQDKEYLKEQFSIYDPDIIICCGTSDLFHSLIEIAPKVAWKNTVRGVPYHEFANGKYLISYRHPEARVASNLLYYGLIDALKEIRGVKPAKR